MNVGIVGHEAAKFTAASEAAARAVIRELLAPPDAILVSGHCHLGGIDIWAEEVADELGRSSLIFPPTTHAWANGYRPRNILIAETSAVVHVIVVNRLPEHYRGMTFKGCYHCHATDHVKSGGCWTGHYAKRHGKPAHWHIVTTPM